MRSLKQKHVEAVFNYWGAQGVAEELLQKRFVIMSAFCEWIGKVGMLDNIKFDFVDRPGD